jgi:hypothetical protein
MSTKDIDLAKIIKLHVPTLEDPVPKMGAGLAGDTVSEVSSRLPEFVRPLKFFAVGAGLTLGDLIGHQFFVPTEGAKTPPGYYGSLLLFSVPALLIGRAAADFLGGPPLLKSVVIGTAANAVLQLRYLFGGFSKGFTWTNFMIHEALLVPLSLLIAGEEESISKGFVASKKHA